MILADAKPVQSLIKFLRKMTTEGYLNWDVMEVKKNSVIRLDSHESWIKVRARLQCRWKNFTFNLYLGTKDTRWRHMLHLRSPGGQWQMISEEGSHQSQDLFAIYDFVTSVNLIKFINEDEIINLGLKKINKIEMSKINKIILNKKLNKGLNNLFGI